MSDPLNFGRPWLENPAWTARRIGYRFRGRIHGCLGVLAVFLLVFLSTPLAFMLERIFSPADNGLAVNVIGGSWVLALVIAVWFGARAVSAKSPSKPYEMVCHLRTFPGVIEGWFKADIEATIPETATEFRAELICVEHFGKSARRVWQATDTVSPARVKATGLTYRIPVAFQIPALARYVPARSLWTLSVFAVSADGMPYRGAFVVPVFATHLAPKDEQRPPDRSDAENQSPSRGR